MSWHTVTVERQREIAARFGIDLTGVTLASGWSAAVRMTDEQVAEGLRVLAGIPPDDGKLR